MSDSSDETTTSDEIITCDDYIGEMDNINELNELTKLNELFTFGTSALNALHCYCNMSNHDIALTCVKELMESGISVNINCYDYINKNTPLYYACIQNNIILVQYMIDNGADINHINKHNESFLNIATEYKHYDLISLLINNGCNLYTYDDVVYTCTLPYNIDGTELYELLSEFDATNDELFTVNSQISDKSGRSLDLSASIDSVSSDDVDNDVINNDVNNNAVNNDVDNDDVDSDDVDNNDVNNDVNYTLDHANKLKDKQFNYVIILINYVIITYVSYYLCKNYIF
jgi:pentatricopeptide repeat protein